MKKKGFVIFLMCCLIITAAACKGDEAGTSYTSGSVTLGEYKGLSYTPVSWEVTEEEINQKIETGILAELTETTEVTDRDTVQDGDWVNIDYKGLWNELEFEGGSAEDTELEIGSNSFIPGFESGLVGAKVGAETTVNVTFPDPYAINPTLAGEDAQFKVTVNSILKKTVPELTDAIVEEKTDYATVAEYRQSVKESLEKTEESNAETSKKNELMGKVIEASTFNSDMTAEIAAYAEEQKAYYENVAKQYYGTDAKQLFSYMYGMDEASYESHIQTMSDSAIKQQYVLGAITEAEKLTLTDDEYNEGLTKYMTSYNYEDEATFLEAMGGEASLREALLYEKAQNVIFDSAVETAAE